MFARRKCSNVGCLTHVYPCICLEITLTSRLKLVKRPYWDVFVRRKRVFQAKKLSQKSVVCSRFSCMYLSEGFAMSEQSALYIHRHRSIINVQPIADRVAKNLEIISQNFQFCTRRTSILMGFIINTMLIAGTNRKFHGQNSESLKIEIIKMISRCFATLSAIGCKNFYDECHRSFMNVRSFIVHS